MSSTASYMFSTDPDREELKVLILSLSKSSIHCMLHQTLVVFKISKKTDYFLVRN